MKFSLSRDVFAQTVSWVARSLPSRAPSPVLAGVKIEASDGNLLLSAFDFETSARASIEADVEETGTILVSGKMLADIANSLPGHTVSVFLDGTKVIIKSGSAKFTLNSMPLSDYPNLPEIPQRGGQIDATVFAAAVGQVAVAASRDDTLPLLTAIKIVIAGDDVRLLSTDRYRLARAKTAWSADDADRSIELLIKAKVLQDVAKSVPSGGTVSVTVNTSGTIVGFAVGGRQITTLVQSGDYPEVERLFPAQTTISAVVSTLELRDAVKRVALVAERNTPIRLAFAGDVVTLIAGSAGDAEASESLHAEVAGGDITVAFNPQYLLEGIGAIHSPSLRLAFTHPSKPVLFNGVDDKGSDVRSYEYLLVPIRTA